MGLTTMAAKLRSRFWRSAAQFQDVAVEPIIFRFFRLLRWLLVLLHSKLCACRAKCRHKEAEPTHKVVKHPTTVQSSTFVLAGAKLRRSR